MARMKLNTKALTQGGIAGAAAPFASRFLGRIGPGVATAATGAVTRNDTLQTLGAYQTAAALVGGTGMPGTNVPSGGFL